jgi:3',5'-cyclic AMP phosphodiesterase CpdA
MHRIAVVADPHVHAVNYLVPGQPAGTPTLRTLLDTVQSTRVFNEGHNALRAALADIAARGIRIVVIAGDMTDDGQRMAWRAFNAIAEEFAERHGLRFYATLGNHDLFAMAGRHHAKRILRPDGSHVLLTSDADAEGDEGVARIVTPEMYCPGYPEVLDFAGRLGFFPAPGDLHWETPFGADPDVAARTYLARSEAGDVTAPMVDASYLVEPETGLWLLSLDANVYVPERAPDGRIAFTDRSDAGWNAALAHKPFLLEWASNVARRARELGKALLCFSHYPVLDPLNGTAEDEQRLLGSTHFTRRMPVAAVGDAFARSGLRAHFSGHWHVNDTALMRTADGVIVNVAMPSLVAFPPAYRIVDLDAEALEAAAVEVSDVAGHDLAFALYRTEQHRTGRDFGDLLQAADHADFLDRQIEQMVVHRYLPREWPADLAALVHRLSLADLARLADTQKSPDGAPVPEMPAGVPGDDLSLFDLIVDWYRLRNGSALAESYVPLARLARYRDLMRRYAAAAWAPGSLQERLQILLRMMERYAGGEPSRDFALDLAAGRIEDRSASPRGRTERRQMGTG